MIGAAGGLAVIAVGRFIEKSPNPLFAELNLSTNMLVLRLFGPRPQPIGRKPQFDAAPRPPVRGWRCATGSESHEVTALAAQKHGLQASLSGESAGRQIWHFVGEENDGAGGCEAFDPAKNPNSSDQLYRRERLRTWRQKHGDDTPVKDPLERALKFYRKLQVDDGHWAGDYGGPHFLSPGLVVCWYVTGRRDSVLDANQGNDMKRYYENHQQSDGGWGTHIESPSTMFGTTLTYVALRLLGEPAEAPRLRKARTFTLIKEKGRSFLMTVGF